MKLWGECTFRCRYRRAPRPISTRSRFSRSSASVCCQSSLCSRVTTRELRKPWQCTDLTGRGYRGLVQSDYLRASYRLPNQLSRCGKESEVLDCVSATATSFAKPFSLVARLAGCSISTTSARRATISTIHRSRLWRWKLTAFSFAANAWQLPSVSSRARRPPLIDLLPRQFVLERLAGVWQRVSQMGQLSAAFDNVKSRKSFILFAFPFF